MNQIKYVLYARKSTEGEDKQKLSLDAQIREMKSIAKRSGHKIVETILESKSAKQPGTRPEFNRMIKLIEKGTFTGILTYEQSRLARNPFEQGKIAQLLQDEKILSIQTCNKNYLPDDNAVVMGVEASIANQYVRDLRRNVKRGIMQKVMNGGISGQAPTGYINNRIDKTIEPDPVRFGLIRKAFDMVLSGHTVQEVRNTLNNDWGYRSHPTKLHKNGRPMSYSTMYYLLANPRYAGRIPDPHEPNKFYKAAFKPMITADEYDRIQRILGVKGKPRLCETKYFALRGLIRCGECGCAITPQTKKKKLKNGNIKEHTYYRCTQKRPCSQRKSTREESLFWQVDELLNHYTISPELYSWGMRALDEIAKQELQERKLVQSMQYTSIEAYQKQLDRLLDMVTEDVITAEDYKSKSNKLKKEMKNLVNEQQESIDRSKNWYELVGGLLENLTDANEKFVESGNSGKRRILQSIGKNPILIDGVLSLDIYQWVKPLRLLTSRNDKDFVTFEYENVRGVIHATKKMLI